VTLKPDELAALPEGLQADTLKTRELIGRKSVAYPMPVGKHSITKSKEFKPRTDDVIVLTFHKTGTTWCQQITHQLRTQGHIEFPEITQVMPWIDFGWEINQDLSADQIASPRLFKSHARLSAVQEGCKYLVTIRDPVKTLKSLFNFFCAKFPKPPFPAAWLANVNNFARCPLWAIDSVWGGNYWEYMVEFYLCREQSNVLCLPFELLKDDLKGQVPKVADFMGIECDEALTEKVAELAHLDWMTKNDDKFNEGWFYEEQLRYQRYDRPPLPPVSKVGLSGNDDQPSEETVVWMQTQWEKQVTPKTGCKDYQEMLIKVTSELTGNPELAEQMATKHKEKLAKELAKKPEPAAAEEKN